jgi:cell division protein FtsI (penicillin-binding protein 3)
MKQNILSRAGIVYFFLLLFAATIIFKIVRIQITEGDALRTALEVNSTRNVIIEPARGDILATDGRLLAISLPMYEIRMDTRTPSEKLFTDSIDALCVGLANLFGRKPASKYKEEIVAARRSGNGYLLIERRVGHNDMKELKKIPIFNLGRNRGGLIIEETYERVQPNGGLAARTIGYTTQDPQGNYPGLEGAFNTYLRGEQGNTVMQRMPSGALRPVPNVNSTQAKNGIDVVSTIDVNIQDVAETALRKQLQHHNAQHGTVVVMEVATGEIKAIVNLGKNVYGNYRELYNYALGEAIEPGSTFKLMTYMALFEDGKIQITDSINNGQSGAVTFFGKAVTDGGRGETFGWLNVEEAFAHSSNISITKFVDKHYRGKERQFIDRLYNMHLNQRLGLELSGEGVPDIKYPGSQYWSGLSLTQMAYGYEVRLAPIHILTFYNAVANDGKMVKPRFVKELSRHGVVEKTFDVQVIKSSIASTSTIRKAKKMLEAAVEYGTARRIQPQMYSIAGKTGTAQVANERYGYRDRKYYASFVGYFPADKPKYSMIVSVYDPKINGYGGGQVAAPVFREISDKIYAADPDMREILAPERRSMMADVPYSKSGSYSEIEYVLRELNIPMERLSGRPNWATASVNETKIEFSLRQMESDRVPNVIDMGLKDALFLLEERGLQVSVRGRGRVVSQSIAAGNRITPGGRITLVMN